MSGAVLVPELVRRADRVVAEAAEPDWRLATDHLVDAVGCLVAGASHPSADGLRRYADLLGDSGPVPALADRPRSMRAAVLLESVYLHLDELDTIHLAGAVVPAAVVVPAALAVGARTGATGGELLAALLGGYEVVVEAALRLGGPALYPERWWPTAAVGALGAAWAAARLQGLDEADRCRAVALAGHAAGGPIGGGDLGEGHYLAGGRAAVAGVEAAYQATAGLRGDPALLDAGLPGGPGRPLGPATTDPAPHLRGCAFKRYPFARPLHAALAGLAELTEAGVPLAGAERIEIRLPAPLTRFVTDTRTPGGPAEAAASAAVAVAAHLAGRAEDAGFPRAAAGCPAPPVVTVVPAEELAADLPERWSSRVVAYLPGGATRSAYVVDAPALAGAAALVEKFRRNARDAPPDAAAEVLATCQDVARLDGVARLREALIAACPPAGGRPG